MKPNNTLLSIFTMLLSFSTPIFADTINSSDFSQKPWMLGFSLGTPALANLEVGKLISPSTGVRFTGMYTGDYNGIQAGFIPYWKRNGNFYRDIALVGGHFRWLDADYQDKYNVERFDEWNYIGMESMMVWKRFFAAPGISFGKGNWDGAMFLLRLGFITHR